MRSRVTERILAAVERIQQAHRRWSQGLIEMGQIWVTDPPSIRVRALEILDGLYDFQDGVLFKPTLASLPNNYRTDQLGTLSYFVGSQHSGSSIIGDHGFALKPWVKVDFEPSSQIVLSECMVSSGMYHFYSSSSSPITVEYTFVYKYSLKDSPLKIVAHHSSLPYRV